MGRIQATNRFFRCLLPARLIGLSPAGDPMQPLWYQPTRGAHISKKRARMNLTMQQPNITRYTGSIRGGSVSLKPVLEDMTKDEHEAS